VDISAAKKAHEAVREAQHRMAEAIAAMVHEPLLLLDANLRVVLANQAFYGTFRVAQEDAVGRLLYDLDNCQWDIPALRNLLEAILPQDAVLKDYDMAWEFEAIGLRTLRLNARRIPPAPDQVELILLTIEDVTHRKTKRARHDDQQG